MLSSSFDTPVRPHIAPYDAMFYSTDISDTLRWLHEQVHPAGEQCSRVLVPVLADLEL